MLLSPEGRDRVRMPKQPVSEKGFQTVRRKSVCQDIIEQFKELVRTNYYGPGSRLPSERELAERLGVSRPSLREALRTLAVMGVLETRHGSGTQIAASSENILNAPFEFLMIIDQPTIYELYEKRELIEVYLAGRAAQHRTPDDLIAIETALNDMRERVEDPPAMTEANVRFHEAVAAAAHDNILGRVVVCLQDGIRACIETTRPAVRDWTVSLDVHHEIYDAIRRQDPEGARRAVGKHMKMAIENLRRVEAHERGEDSHEHSADPHLDGVDMFVSSHDGP